jgi:hypothetical protein
MKTKAIRMTALAMLSAALFTVTSCSSTPKSPPPVGSGWFTYTKDQPGGVRVQTIKITATVTAMDKAKRNATLRASDGKTFMVKVGPEAVNFDQFKVGDPINATVTERVVESLAKEGDTSGAGTTAGETTQYTAKVIAIDLEKRTGTLRFEDGSMETLPILNDANLSRDMVGRQIVFRVTERIAIWVEKPQ